jgi:alpha-L-fucosidase
MEGIQPEPWQTDTSIGDWYYRTGQKYKSSTQVIHLLADIVSKNGNLLLNVVQTPEGDLEPDVVAIVEEISRWMQVNGEAIYRTRPWKIYGEDAPGKTAVSAGNFNEDRIKYTEKALRFTASKDGSILYVIALGWPSDRKLLIKSLRLGSTVWPNEVGMVRLLGGPANLTTTRSAEGLQVQLPVEKPCSSAYAFAITLR